MYNLKEGGFKEYFIKYCKMNKVNKLINEIIILLI